MQNVVTSYSHLDSCMVANLLHFVINSCKTTDARISLPLLTSKTCTLHANKNDNHTLCTFHML